jgi:hypothetical protein
MFEEASKDVKGRFKGNLIEEDVSSSYSLPDSRLAIGRNCVIHSSIKQFFLIGL